MGYRLEGGRSRTRKQVGGGTAVGFQHGRQITAPPIAPASMHVRRSAERSSGRSRSHVADAQHGVPAAAGQHRRHQDRGQRPGLQRRVVLAMIKRRAAAAELPPSTCCHTFRATGITAYLSNGGTLEHAQQIAGHASPKTTKLYDRTADTVTVDEIERIVI